MFQLQCHDEFYKYYMIVVYIHVLLLLLSKCLPHWVDNKLKFPLQASTLLVITASQKFYVNPIAIPLYKQFYVTWVVFVPAENYDRLSISLVY